MIVYSEKLDGILDGKSAAASLRGCVLLKWHRFLKMHPRFDIKDC